MIAQHVTGEAACTFRQHRYSFFLHIISHKQSFNTDPPVAITVSVKPSYKLLGEIKCSLALSLSLSPRPLLESAFFFFAVIPFCVELSF